MKNAKSLTKCSWKEKINETYIKFIDTSYCVVCSETKKKCTIQTDRHRKINNNNKPLCEGFFPQTPYPFTHEHRQQKLKPIVHTHTYTLSTFRDRIEQPQNRIKVHNTITKIQFVWQHSQYTSNPTIFMERVWSKRKN